jgi:ketosteroid isomerase-like protein
MDFFAGVRNKCSFHVSRLMKRRRATRCFKGELFPMSLDLRMTLATIGLVLTFSFISAGRAQQKVLTNEQSQIVDAVNTIFTAIQSDDAAKLNAVVSPDFYIFDGGRRFNAEQVETIFKTQHLAGKRYDWNVTEPDIHISGNTAWIAYVNDGSISDASGRVHQQWLESGFLEKQAGTWKVVFMQSTRVPPPQEDRK